MSRTFYLTTPIYYVNDAPHIGHAYTTILADVLARYRRLFGEETYFLTGTDEHGQKVQQAAGKKGIAPDDHQGLLEYCDHYARRFQEAWKDLDIGYDRFIRTTEKEHVEYVRAQFRKLWDGGWIYPKEYAGWYSTTEERFFSEKELVDGKDPISGRPVEWIVEKNYFFKMSAFQERLIAHLEAHPDFVLPDFRRNEVLGFLRQPLADLCISRPKTRLSWGIPLPFDAEFVSYVWVDALLNYATAAQGRSRAEGEPLWPADLHLIGKDILTTHAVYWPTLLMALDLPLPRHILAHGWWLVDNARMSKTTGNVVSPLEMKDKYGVDAFRFFLIREMTLGQDASFSEEAFVARLNADLANDVGNALSRVLKLAQSLGSVLEARPAVGDADRALVAAAEKALREVPEAVLSFRLSAAAEETLALFRAVNRYLEATAPWKLAKAEDGKERLAGVLWHAAEALRLGFVLLSPIMPGKMRAALETLGVEAGKPDSAWRSAQAAFRLRPAGPLFQRVLPAAPAAPAPAPPEDPFSAVDLRAARILSAEDHPGADALYVLKVDAGEPEPRTVCAGLRKHLPREELAGRMAVLVANLKPALLRGVASQGMLLAAEGGEGRLALALPENASPGDPVRAEGLNAAPKPQISLKDFEKTRLIVRGGRVYAGEYALKTPAGPVTASAPDGATVR